MRTGRLFAAATAVALIAVGMTASPASAVSGMPTLARAHAAGPAATPPAHRALSTDGQTNRYLLGGTWMMIQDPGNQGLADGYWRGQASTVGWTPVTMPNSFNAGDLSSASFAGSIAWYRRDFTLPAKAFSSYVPHWARRWVIQFESVNYNATVWLNGRLIGRHQGAYLPFEFTLKHLHRGVNHLVVRVSNQLTPADLPPSNAGPSWWNFGGILDVVYLRPVARADISGVRIRTPMACPTCRATIQEQATIRNVTSRPQTVVLTGRYGRQTLQFGEQRIGPGRTWRPRATAVIQHPRLWAPGSPHLYLSTLRLTDRHGRRLGGYRYLSGIRTIAVHQGLLEINGRQVHLRGVSIQEQTAGTGAAMSLGAMRTLIGWTADLGATIIRAHYPLNPELEEMADRAGILLWSEIPAFNPGAAFQASARWRRRAVGVLKNDISVNQDHPSILLWSIGNEFSTPPQPGQAQYIKSAAAAAHRLDPTRPVGMALKGVPWPGCQSEYAPLQVIGVNSYYGWFQAGGVYDNRQDLGPFLRSVHRCYRNKALFASEFGFGANRSGPIEVKGTYANQSYNIEYALSVFDSEPWLAGATYQMLQDWVSQPGWDGSDPFGTPPVVDKGLITRNGVKKPAFAVTSALYHATVQIAPAPLLPAVRGR